jgi:hypothetical protein
MPDKVAFLSDEFLSEWKKFYVLMLPSVPGQTPVDEIAAGCLRAARLEIEKRRHDAKMYSMCPRDIEDRD